MSTHADSNFKLGGVKPSPANQDNPSPTPIQGAARQFRNRLSKRVLVQSSSGVSIATAFPLMKRVQQVRFPSSILIKHVDAAMSILTDSGIGAVYLVEGYDSPATLNLTDMAKAICGMVTNAPANAALAQAITRVISEDMLGEGLIIPSETGLSIYAASSNSANNLVTATFNIIYETVPSV